jgi:hypothetical protein
MKFFTLVADLTGPASLTTNSVYFCFNRFHGVRFGSKKEQSIAQTLSKLPRLSERLSCGILLIFCAVSSEIKPFSDSDDPYNTAFLVGFSLHPLKTSDFHRGIK